MAGWHGSTGHVPRIHCWCFGPIQLTVPQFVGLARDPWVLFICSTGLIDSVFLHPCSHCTTNILVMPNVSKWAKMLLLLWSVADALFFQVLVLCDVYGLFVFPAAGRHVFCHWCEGLVGRTAIHIPRYCLFTNQMYYTDVYALVIIKTSETWMAHDCTPYIHWKIHFLKQQWIFLYWVTWLLCGINPHR